MSAEAVAACLHALVQWSPVDESPPSPLFLRCLTYLMATGKKYKSVGIVVSRSPVSDGVLPPGDALPPPLRVGAEALLRRLYNVAVADMYLLSSSDVRRVRA